MDMYCRLFKQLLVEELYAAVKAGFKYDINVSNTGFILQISGYNETLPVSIRSVCFGVINTISRYIIIFILQFLAGFFALNMMEYSNYITNDMFESIKNQQSQLYHFSISKPEIFMKY